LQYYALQKLDQEQKEVESVWQRVSEHREHERGKLQERAMRRMALQAKAGQVILRLSLLPSHTLKK